MAKVTSIGAGYERKFNLGDYESLKLSATVWADMEDGDDPKVVIKTLQDLCRDSVRAEFKVYWKNKRKPGQAAEAKTALPEP